MESGQSINLDLSDEEQILIENNEINMKKIYRRP
jgi:hypothetical protein